MGGSEQSQELEQDFLVNVCPLDPDDPAFESCTACQ